MDRWSGKIAVVTGASAGIGAAIAETLVEEGLQVVGIARRKERVEELASKLADRKGKLIPYKADLTNKDEILEAFKWIAQNVGPVSILINNAGLGRKTTIVNGDIDDWKKILDTNVFGLAVASRQAIQSMQENQIDGHIININSILGHYVSSLPYQNLYPASKFAVTAFTETLRRELISMKSKIKVTSVSPGLVATEIFEANGFADSPELRKRLEECTILASVDIANAVLYVLGTPPHVQVSELTILPVGEVI